MGLQACRVWVHAGTFHYVYTVRKKLVVAGDFCNASGWRARVSAAEEWLEKQGKGEKEHATVPIVKMAEAAPSTAPPSTTTTAWCLEMTR